MVGIARRESTREDLELRAYKASEIVAKLRELKVAEGWSTLIEVFTAAKEQYYAAVTQQLMRGREINQRKLDYNRGFFDGVTKLLEQPETAESVLEKALARLAEAANEE